MSQEATLSDTQRLERVERALFNSTPPTFMPEDIQHYVESHHIRIKVHYEGKKSHISHIRTKVFSQRDSMGFVILCILDQLQSKLVDTCGSGTVQFTSLLQAYDIQYMTNNPHSPWVSYTEAPNSRMSIQNVLRSLNTSQMEIQIKKQSQPQNIASILSWWSLFFNCKQKNKSQLKVKDDGRVSPVHMEDDGNEEKERGEEDMSMDQSEDHFGTSSSLSSSNRSTKRSRETEVGANKKSSTLVFDPNIGNKVLDQIFNQGSKGMTNFLVSLLDKKDSLNLLKTSTRFDKSLGSGNSTSMNVDAGRSNHFVSISTWVSIALYTPSILYLFSRVYLSDVLEVHYSQRPHVINYKASDQSGGKHSELTYTDFMSLLFPMFAKYVKSILVRCESFLDESPINPILQGVFSQPSKVSAISYDCIVVKKNEDKFPFLSFRANQFENLHTSRTILYNQGINMRQRFFETLTPRWLTESTSLHPMEDENMYTFEPRIINIRFYVTHFDTKLKNQILYLVGVLQDTRIVELRMTVDVVINGTTDPREDDKNKLLTSLFHSVKDCRSLRTLYVVVTVKLDKDTNPVEAAEVKEDSMVKDLRIQKIKNTIRLLDDGVATACRNGFIEVLQLESAYIPSLTRALSAELNVTSIKKLDFTLREGNSFSTYRSELFNKIGTLISFFAIVSKAKSISSFRFNLNDLASDLEKVTTVMPFITSLCISNLYTSVPIPNPLLSVNQTCSFLSLFSNVSFLQMDVSELVLPKVLFGKLDETEVKSKGQFYSMLIFIVKNTRLKIIVFDVEFLWKLLTPDMRQISELKDIFSPDDFKVMNDILTRFPHSIQELVISLKPRYFRHENSRLEAVVDSTFTSPDETYLTQKIIDTENQFIKDSFPKSLSNVFKYTLEGEELLKQLVM